MWHWTWLGCFGSDLSRLASCSFSVHSCQGLQLGQSLFPWLSISRERDGGWESFTEKQKADKGDDYSRLPPASCSPHRNGHFSLTWTPDCKAAPLSSPPYGLLLLSPGHLWMWSEQLPSLSSSSLRSQTLWDRAVAFLCFQRNIYGSNFYNLHLSLNILVFFPQGFQCYSRQKGCLISQMSFALLVSFIIFMLSIESTYILFPSDNLSSLQWAGC